MLLAFVLTCSTSSDTSDEKVLSNLKSGMSRSSPIMQEKVYSWRRRQSRLSIFLDKWKNNIFRDNWRGIRMSYSIDQRLKMSQFLMAIFLVYSIPGITSDKNLVATSCGGHLENVKISNTDSIWQQKWKHHPKLCKKIWWWRHRCIYRVTLKLSLYIPYKCKNNIFGDNCRRNKYLIFKLGEHMELSWLLLWWRHRVPK